jgi:phosphoribosylformimino-5-aminoimidazole carboxamide ribotide isomerase
MLVIPAIDLRRGKSVRLAQGRKDSVTVYADDPVAIVETFVRDGAQLLHVIDLDAAFSESNSLNREVLLGIIRAVDIPVQLGGGLRSIRDVEQVLELGVDRVVIGTVAVESPETLTEMLRLFGAERVVVGIDAKQEQAVTHGWETSQRMDALTLSRRVASVGVERVIYTDVGRDGMLTGVNIEQTCRIAEASGLKVTASGGVSSLEDIKRLATVSICGIDSVIVGKALYEGRFTLAEAMEVAAR